MKQDIAEIATHLADLVENALCYAEHYRDRAPNAASRSDADSLMDETRRYLAHLLAHSHPEKPPSPGIYHSEVNKDRNANEERPNR